MIWKGDLLRQHNLIELFTLVLFVKIELSTVFHDVNDTRSTSVPTCITSIINYTVTFPALLVLHSHSNYAPPPSSRKKHHTKIPQRHLRDGSSELCTSGTELQLLHHTQPRHSEGNCSLLKWRIGQNIIIQRLIIRKFILLFLWYKTK